MPTTTTRRLSPSKSLQKLRTAFSHSPTRRTEEPRSHSPLSPTTSASSSSPSTSPAPTQQGAFPGFAGFTFGNSSPVLSPSDFDSRRVIRRKKSCVEIEQEMERTLFDDALVGLVEPRPSVGPALGGIEEILCGEV